MSLRPLRRSLLVLILNVAAVSAGLASIEGELRAHYPKPPKQLETDPATSSVLLVDFDLVGIIHLNNLDGAALRKQGQDGAMIRAGTMKGRLVMFNDLEAGTYSLEFLRLGNYNADLVLQRPPAVAIEVTVTKGAVAYLGSVVVTKKFGPDPPIMQLAYDAKREVEAWSTFKSKYAGSPWVAVADRRIASLQSPVQSSDRPPGGAPEQGRTGAGGQDDPLRILAGDWDMTAFVIGRDHFGGPRCGKTDRPGPGRVIIAPSAENAVSLAVSCDDGSEYAFRLEHDPAVKDYLLTVTSKTGVSVDNFPVAYVADHGWKGAREVSMGDGRRVPITASIELIEAKNWYGWAIFILPTADADRPPEEIDVPYFRADLTRRKD